MKNPIGIMAFLLLLLGTPSQSLVAGNQDGTEPYLVNGKFKLPLNTDEIKELWKALGYFQCEYDGKEKGWSSERAGRHKGEHTPLVHLVCREKREDGVHHPRPAFCA